MVESGTSSAFRGWARVRVLGYGFGARGRKVKSRDCALASDLVRAHSKRLFIQLLLSLHNPVARAARALAGRYKRASEPRGARRAILV